MILTLKTDNPEAYIGILNEGIETAHDQWLAERNLARDLLQRIRMFLEAQQCSLNDLAGIVVYSGPGSFTGLRIGTSVANAIAYAYQIPVVGCGGQNWQQDGQDRLQSGHNQSIVVPEYGGSVFITTPKK